MNYFVILPPGPGRFLEEYMEGNLDSSWCEVAGDSSNLQECSLKATKTKVKDIYWFITEGGFDMAMNEATLNLIFSSSLGKIKITELWITYRSKKRLEVPEKVFHVTWLDEKINVDLEKVEALKDVEIPVGGEMRFVKDLLEIDSQVGQLSYFHSQFIVSELIATKIADQKIEQIRVMPLDRVPLDSGNLQVQSKNDINRLIEQGLSREDAEHHWKLVASSNKPQNSLKKWRNGKYV